MLGKDRWLGKVREGVMGIIDYCSRMRGQACVVLIGRR